MIVRDSPGCGCLHWSANDESASRGPGMSGLLAKSAAGVFAIAARHVPSTLVVADTTAFPRVDAQCMSRSSSNPAAFLLAHCLLPALHLPLLSQSSPTPFPTSRRSLARPPGPAPGTGGRKASPLPRPACNLFVHVDAIRADSDGRRIGAGRRIGDGRRIEDGRRIGDVAEAFLLYTYTAIYIYSHLHIHLAIYIYSHIHI